MKTVAHDRNNMISLFSAKKKIKINIQAVPVKKKKQKKSSGKIIIQKINEDNMCTNLNESLSTFDDLCSVQGTLK